MCQETLFIFKRDMIREKLGLVRVNYLRQANTQQISAINVLKEHCLSTSKKGLGRLIQDTFYV